MPAAITFYAADFQIGGGSGLGFFGASFSSAVRVGEYQGTTFITNSAGTAQGPQVNNVKFFNAGSGYIGSATSATGLLYVPSYLATLNPRFTNDTPVRVQNVVMRIYDRVSTSNPASGVTTKAAEIIHPSPLQTVQGSGDSVWTTFTGVTGVTLSLAQSPAMSGIYAGNGSTSQATSTRHDWYVALSASPDSIGSKLFAASMELEYL